MKRRTLVEMFNDTKPQCYCVGCFDRWKRKYRAANRRKAKRSKSPKGV